MAAQDGRTLLTFDLDFGELVARQNVTVPAGIVLFRVRAGNRSDVSQFVVDTILAHSDWAGHLWIVEHDRIRSRPLPGTREDR